MTAGLHDADDTPVITPAPRQPSALAQPAAPDANSLGSLVAWETLKLVTEWIKLAETKASVALAGSGLVGGVLYTLVTSQHRSSTAFALAATACAICVFVAAFAAGMALKPRLHVRPAPTSLLYYHHVARRFRTDVDGYASALAALLGDPNALIAAIAAQIWANAHVARRKYRWSNVGLLALLGALAACAAAAAIVATETIISP